ncbi:MAG: translocation protein TolB [Gemmatimonadetes bacterium]|nr:translocation protein TolB [Gemmatimonadota bacterium]
MTPSHSPPMRRAPGIALAALLGALLAACGSDSGPTVPTQTLIAVGRLERGATVRLVAREGAAGSDSVVSNLTITPATAGVVTGTTIKLVQVGPATIGATASDGRTLSAAVTVAAPPTVFFDAIAAGNRDIYSISLDGGDLKRWTTAPAEESHPSVAAGLLVFSSTRDGNGELYSLSTAAGGIEKRLTTTAANESQPALAAGGANLAYVSDGGGVPRIFVSTAALAVPSRLTAPSFGFGGSIESDPTWSPTGDRIAFMSTTNGRANLFISPSGAGSNPTAVVGSGAQQTDVEPAWSPDGNKIVFASTRGGGTLLYLLDLKTDAFNQVTQATGTIGQPAWLPDGRLLYTKFAAGESTLWYVDPAQSTSTPVEIPTGTKSPAHPAPLRP